MHDLDMVRDLMALLVVGALPWLGLGPIQLGRLGVGVAVEPAPDICQLFPWWPGCP